MTNNWQEIFTPPRLYEKSAAAFWDDEYISQQMLINHLNPTIDAASRKLKFIQESVAWITKIAPPKSHSRLLDLGCGPGIYAELLTAAGYQVTGVDFSQNSIDYAKKSAEKNNLSITYLKQNYLELALEEQFDLIIMIYCDYGALAIDERQLILQTVHQNLRSGGKFLFDAFSMAKFSSLNEKQTWEYSTGNSFWAAQPHLALNRTILYPHNVSLEQAIILKEKEVTPYNIWNTFFDKKTLIKEVAPFDFKIIDSFSDVAGKTFNPTNETLALLLEK